MVEINGKLFDWDAKKNLVNIKKHGVSFKMIFTEAVLMDFGLKSKPDANRVRKNVFYEDIAKNGFSIIVHYTPEDAQEIINNAQDFDFYLLQHNPDELAAFEKYNKNYIFLGEINK